MLHWRKHLIAYLNNLLRLTGNSSSSLPLPCTPPPPVYPLRLISRLHQPHDASHPPVAGHDDPTGHPAASVVVRPGVVPPQRLADPLAVGVTTSALVAAHALVVQHGVDVHGGLLALQTSLTWDR